MAGLVPLNHKVELLFDKVEYVYSLDSLVCRVALPNQIRVVDQEEHEHDCNNAAEEHCDSKHFVPCLQVLHYDPNIRSELLSFRIRVVLVPQLPLFNQMLRAQHANNEAINADASVEEKEQQEVFVIVEAHSVVEPDAVVVKLLNADFVHDAVLRARWFRYVASVAPAFLVKEQLIVRIALYSAFQVGLRHCFT